MNNAVSLRVNGIDYGGWLQVEIAAGIERQARDFSLAITKAWPGAKDIPRQIRPGDVCEVFIGTDKVLTGYVDGTPIRYDGNSVSVSVQGRSKTADLVDCAAEFSTGQWRGRKIERIAADLAQPYGITVITEVSTGAAIADHQIQPGETAFESINRLLTLRQLLSTDDEQGRLVLVNAGSGGKTATALVYGENILSAETSLDYKDVFSTYVCKGQRSGDDNDFGDAVASSAKASDQSVQRHRLMIIQESGQVDRQACIDRVSYERLYRASKALETTYVVQGWRQGDGNLWKPNQLVRVFDPVIGFDDELLIVEVTYQLSEQGTTSALRVAPAAGFIPSPEATKQAKAKKGSGGDWSKDAELVLFPVKANP